MICPPNLFILIRSFGTEDDPCITKWVLTNVEPYFFDLNIHSKSLTVGGFENLYQHTRVKSRASTLSFKKELLHGNEKVANR